MKRKHSLTIDECVSLKKFVPTDARIGLRSSWVGVCQEILAALEGDEDHDVIRVDGRRVIYREGYPYPHFIEVAGSAFACPYWG